MGLFDTNQTQTSTVSVPGRGAGELELLALLQAMQGQGMGAAGNLEGLATGQGFQITPLMQELVRQAVGSQASLAKENALNAFRDDRGVQRDAVSRGIDSSSIEAANMALSKQALDRNLNAIDLTAMGQASGALLDLPFRVGQQQLDANSLLLNLLTQSSSMLNENYLRDRLSRTTTTTDIEGGGGLFGSLFGIASNLAGAGGFNPLLASLGSNNTNPYDDNVIANTG